MPNPSLHAAALRRIDAAYNDPKADAIVELLTGLSEERCRALAMVVLDQSALHPADLGEIVDRIPPDEVPDGR